MNFAENFKRFNKFYRGPNPLLFLQRLLLMAPEKFTIKASIKNIRSFIFLLVTSFEFWTCLRKFYEFISNSLKANTIWSRSFVLSIWKCTDLSQRKYSDMQYR